MIPQSPSKWAPWDLTQFSQHLSHCSKYCKILCWNHHQLLVIFSLISLMVWNIFPFKGDFSFGEARSLREPNLGCRGLSHMGDLMFCQKSLHGKWCMSRCIVLMKLPNQQLPIAAASWLVCIFRREMFTLSAKFDADSLLYWLSNFECNGHTAHVLTQRHLPPPLLVLWSCHCSRVCIPVPSSWLPGYIDVMQTVLLILTMVRLFPDRPCTSVCNRRGLIPL